MNHNFHELIAQKLHAGYRIQILSGSSGTSPSTSSGSSAPSPPSIPPAVSSMLANVEGFIINEKWMRLFQNAVSTRILEGVLVAMVLCAIVHFILTLNTKILPKDPGSIAAKMSLFVDSEMLARMPEAADRLGNSGDGDELGSRDVFEGQTSSLGWWGGGEGGGTRRFGIDIGKADDEA